MWLSLGYRRRALALTLLSALWLQGCGGGDPPTVSSATFTSVDQVGVVGTELSLPVEARIFDDTGEPLGGRTVDVVAVGAGTVVPDAATSDRDGYVRVRWTLGAVAGQQALRVIAPDKSGELQILATQYATATAGPLASVEAIDGDRQAGAVGQRLPIAVRVRTADRFGNAIRMMMISFVPLNGGQTAIDHVLTGDDGTTYTFWTLGPAPGPQTMVVTASPISPAPEISVTVRATGQ